MSKNCEINSDEGDNLIHCEENVQINVKCLEIFLANRTD